MQSFTRTRRGFTPIGDTGYSYEPVYTSLDETDLNIRGFVLHFRTGGPLIHENGDVVVVPTLRCLIWHVQKMNAPNLSDDVIKGILNEPN